MNKPQLITTADGSHTLFLPELNETYHSKSGALRESQYVFIQHGLEYVVKEKKITPVRILEIGFGTGLNALLALQFSRENPGIEIYYHTIEKFPVPAEVIASLNYTNQETLKHLHDDFQQLHECAWEVPATIFPGFIFQKINADILSDNWKIPKADLVFFDAFAPSRQPELWETSVFCKMKDSLQPDGILVSYCASSQFKRNLKSAGFTVETLAGPPGKREMVRAFAG